MSLEALDIKCYESLTCYATHEVLKWRYREDQGTATKVFTIITCEAAFLGLTLFGTIETIFRFNMYLVVKVINLIVRSDSLDKDIERFLDLTALYTSISGYQLIGNLLKNGNYEPLMQYMIQHEKIKKQFKDSGLSTSSTFKSPTSGTFSGRTPMETFIMQQVFQGLGEEMQPESNNARSYGSSHNKPPMRSPFGGSGDPSAVPIECTVQ